jgi:hypothetical protein
MVGMNCQENPRTILIYNFGKFMIVIFNGPPSSGKDEACLYFKKLGYIHLSFKEELFKETFKFFSVSKDWFMKGYNDRSVKETPVPQLKVNGTTLSRRDAMIYVSEQHIKPKFGKEYFGAKLASQIQLDNRYCVSDGGFEEELTPVINKIGADKVILVQLTRDGCDFSSDSRKYFNGNLVREFVLRKETNISNFHMLSKKFDIRTYRVHNNGTIEEFRSVLQLIHEKESDVQNKKTKSDTDSDFIRKSL